MQGRDLPMPHYFDELKRYLRFDEVDEEALRRLHPFAEPIFSVITHDFYERLRSHPEAMAVFRSDEQVLRLQATLERWMDRLLRGPWDDEYFEKRSRIGKVHVKIQLPQHHMFSAMAVVQEHLAGVAFEHLSFSEAQASVAALQKITNIDLAIMLDSYRDDYVDKVQGYERRSKAALEARLEQSQALYHSIFESSGAAIITTNEDRQVQLYNSMAETLTGFSRQEVKGKPVDSSIVHPLDAEKMRALLKRAKQGPAQTPEVLRVITSQGFDKWVRWRCSPIKETTDVCLIGVDVTRERRLELQTQRVQTLAALGTLAAGLAHEIRNPLNAAQLQLLLVDRAISKAGDAVDDRALKSSELVKTELKRLAGLVEDFLAFARPSELRIKNADLSGLCQTITTLLEGDALSADTTLSAKIEKDVFARVDLERLKQVLINLLRNAVDASGQGGEVELRCRRVSQSVILEVIDDGPGVPEDIDIFEPFTTSKDTGTGLGLSIVHRIVSDHQGMIEVQRKDNKTVFTVELPVDGPESPI
jgi:PAS domain S-box-containing protein